jgi:hypothetical protein
MPLFITLNSAWLREHFMVTHPEFAETLFYYHIAYLDCLILLTMICAIETLVFKPPLSSPYGCPGPFADSSFELKGIWQNISLGAQDRKNCN